MGEPVSTTAMIGLALAAAGTAVNYQQQKKKSEEIGDIADATRAKNEKQRKEGLAYWERELGDLTPEEQQKKIAEETAAREQAYTAASMDAPPELDIITPSADAPAVVKTETAKQLNKRLDSAKGQIRAQAALAGFDANLFNQGIGLNRASQNIALNADAIRGNQTAAGYDINAVNAAPISPIGDILQAGGGAMMGWSAPVASGTQLAPMTAGDQQWLNWYNQIG